MDTQRLILFFIFGFLVGHYARQVYLPRITGYVLAGVLCGPYVGGLLSAPVVKEVAQDWATQVRPPSVERLTATAPSAGPKATKPK